MEIVNETINYPKNVGSDFVIHYVADLNDREDPYEGEVPERIALFTTYTLRDFPISRLALTGYGYSPDLASEYAAMDADTSPPIVIDGDGEIIDGFHRAHAAIARGDTIILAYVGNP